MLDISRDKTTVMCIGSAHPRGIVFHMDNIDLRITTEVRDLGVLYSSSLSFEKYIDDVVAKAYRKCNFILRAFRTRDSSTLFRLFTVYVRPLLEYCTPIWSPSKRTYIDKIERVQKRFTSQIFMRNGLFDISYRERLNVLGSTSLQLRRVIYDENLIFKIVFGAVDIDSHELLNFSEFSDRTRGHPLRISTGRVRTQQFLESFLVRAPRMWNSLPNDVVASPTAAVFNQRLESYLRQKGTA